MRSVPGLKRKLGRMPKKYSQAARLHDLIRILEARYGATVDELVEECQVTRRTIYRDLQAILEKLGTLPIFSCNIHSSTLLSPHAKNRSHNSPRLSPPRNPTRQQPLFSFF